MGRGHFASASRPRKATRANEQPNIIAFSHSDWQADAYSERCPDTAAFVHPLEQPHSCALEQPNIIELGRASGRAGA